MITDRDITRLKEVFVTKMDFTSLKEEFADLRLDVGELKDKIGGLEESVESIHVKIDTFIGIVSDVQIDNSAGNVTLNRHGRHIQALAENTNTILPD